MDSYTVVITETLKRFITITAENAESAEEEIRRQYRNGDIILDSDDYFDTDIATRKNKTKT